jgi:hypothetical protein
MWLMLYRILQTASCTGTCNPINSRDEALKLNFAERKVYNLKFTNTLNTYSQTNTKAEFFAYRWFCELCMCTEMQRHSELSGGSTNICSWESKICTGFHIFVSNTALGTSSELICILEFYKYLKWFSRLYGRTDWIETRLWFLTGNSECFSSPSNAEWFLDIPNAYATDVKLIFQLYLVLRFRALPPHLYYVFITWW